MVNAAKARGTNAETKVVAYLRENGWPDAERRALQGANDTGDVSGMGRQLVVEIKDVRQAAAWAEWMNETEKERRRANARYGIMVRRRVGRPNPADWYACLPLGQLCALLVEAGYGK